MPGADSFAFGKLNDDNTGGAVFIADFNPAQGDTVDLSPALNLDGHHYSSLAAAIADGTIGVKYDHGYTDLYYD